MLPVTAEPHLQGRASTTVIRRPLLLSALFAVLSTLILADLAPRLAPGLLRFEHYMGDVRTAWLSDQLPSQHPQVAIVAVTDDTLAGYKTFLPVDRHLLARVVDALDAAGAKVIGLDFLFAVPAPDDNELLLIDAIRRARAKIVLAVADERVGLTPAQREKQQAFVREVGRPAGYANLATERDSVVRFMAQPYSEGAPAYPKSFAALLAENAGAAPVAWRPRIAWLRNPRDGSDVFLTTSAETLLRPADDPVAKIVREGLRDKIVLVGGALREIDSHLTPLTDSPSERMHGVAIHAHIAAQLVDGRSIGQLETNSYALRLALAGVAALAFLVGWGFRTKRQGLLASGVASAVIIAADTIVFWQFRIILPLVLALAAWFLGEFSGHYLGKWLGPRAERSLLYGK
jgi:adenylate cyclase